MPTPSILVDPKTTLRRRVGDTPLLKAPRLAEYVGLPNLRLKMEGSNPTGTQKDRVARLELSNARAHGSKSVSVGSCGNFGVAIAHAAYVHDLECHVFVPEHFRGERISLMEDLNAKVHRVPGQYEDAVAASRAFAAKNEAFDANPGGANTLRTLAGYSTIAQEVIDRLGDAPKAVGCPVGNGSTLAGVHLGFRTAWAQNRAKDMPKFFAGSSMGHNPIASAFEHGATRCTPIDAASILETEVNEPLVNWDALDGTACLTAVLDSRGAAYGFEDQELMDLHQALLEDGIDAHPASLAAVAALARARTDGHIDADDRVVAIMTSGRAQVHVEQISQPDDMPAFIARLKEYLGRFDDPVNEMMEAVTVAFDHGIVLEARDNEGVLGYTVLTPMELSQFFPRYHLSYICVNKRARGRGVGTILLEEALRATEGDLSLHVETDNENAIRLYEKFGFTKKYYRMLYKGARTATVDTAAGSGWHENEEPVQMLDPEAPDAKTPAKL